MTDDSDDVAQGEVAEPQPAEPTAPAVGEVDTASQDAADGIIEISAEVGVNEANTSY